MNLKTLVLATAVLGLAASAAGAGQAVRYHGGVDQHTTVMNNIYQAQQQNNAAISHVQNNIRSTQPKVY